MCDINSGIYSSSMVSFADDCAILQNDLNSVYEWASDNNMFFNAQKFQYLCFNPHISLFCNVYTSSSLDISVPVSIFHRNSAAAIITIYKSGNKTVPSNYRLISLTSVICKVLESIIRKQVFSFLDQKGCLNSTQHGFRSGRSCLPALLDVFDNIMHIIALWCGPRIASLHLLRYVVRGD